MRAFAFATLLGSASATNEHDEARAQLAAHVNSQPGVAWRAGVVDRFRGQPIGASRPLLGVHNNSKLGLELAIGLGEVTRVSGRAGVSVPDSFDAAENWPQCKKIINDIRDQSNCGCCWAFAGAEAASDRLCIWSNASVMMPLSAQNVCFCASDDGCQGGMVSQPWDYIKTTGVVTGAQNGATDKGNTDPFLGAGLCSDFSLPHCHHHGPQGSDPYPAEGATGCPKATSPKCPASCDSSAKAPHNDFEKDKWSYTGETQAYQGEDAIQQAVMQHGPVEVAFSVYSDFETYTSGVYHHVSGSMEGGHAVKLVGWGVDNGMKYWKIANSWNPNWGEKGFFRIKRGSNECGIEDQVAANDGSGKWQQGTPPPTQPPKPGDCKKQLDKDCGADKGKSNCLQCTIAHVADLKDAGCDASTIFGYCQ